MGAMEQHPGPEGKTNIHVLLATAGAWPFWMLVSVGCEPRQSFECAVHSHSLVPFGTRDDSGKLGPGCEILQCLPGLWVDFMEGAQNGDKIKLVF